MEIVNVTFTETECNQLATLLDTAVRAEGIPAAVVAVPLFLKLKEALDASKKEKTNVPAN